MARIGISLPDWYVRKLALWAKLKGTNKATLAANVLQARIESNWKEVSAEIDEIAQRRGIPREKLEEEWLDGYE